MFFKTRIRVFGAVLLALILAAAVYGFAAGNTVPDSHAGDGDGGVSGYTVSNISYTLDSSDPTKVASVSFSLDNTASDVYAAVGDNASPTNWTWSNACSLSGSTWTCTFATEPSVLDIYRLRVVATGP